MPTININRKVLDSLIGKKLTTDELKERIVYLGTALERIDENEIQVEIFPNRPDMLSEQGFGRALSAFVGVNTGLRKYHVKVSGQNVIIDKEMKNVRPYTACAIVKGLHLNDEKIKELVDIQEKLHITYCRRRKKAAMGIYPFEKIKAPIYFKADDPDKIVFRPLEWPTEISAREILEVHPKGKEFAHLVEGLKKYAYFADSTGAVLSFTPVINSHLTGKITEETKDVFVEVSGYDFHVCEIVLNILVCAMADMGGQIYSMELHYPDRLVVTPDLNPREMDIDIDYINRKLGLSLKEKDLKALLEKMGHGYKDNKVLVPAYRADIIHPIDIAEDVAIAYGFENFAPEIPKIGTTGGEDSFEKFVSRVSDLLVGLDFSEVSSYHLSNPDKECRKMNQERDIILLANALTEDYDALRASILPSVLQIYSENRHNEYPQNIFEAGTVFSKDEKTETGVLEQRSLCVALSAKDSDFTKIKQALDYLSRSLGIKLDVKEHEDSSFLKGRTGKICMDREQLGIIGEVSPQVLENFSLDMPVAAFELNLSRLYSRIK